VTALQGARESETATLEWHHLDFDKKQIAYLETKNGEDYYFPMTERVYEILVARRDAEDRHPRWVFPAKRPRRNGMELMHISVPPADAVRMIVESSGVVWAMHDLRRTYTNTLMMLGVEERERDYMLKHKINDVSVHYEDLSLMLEENLQMYENRVLSLVKADTVEE
jgi:integrase